MNNKNIKCLIELSTSFDEADKVLSKYTLFRTNEEKIEYLSKLFGCEIIDKNSNDLRTDYVALLTTIVNGKWR